MSAKHAHKQTKERQHLAHAASLKAKKKSPKIVYAGPLPWLFKKAKLVDGREGMVVGYTANCKGDLYTVDFGGKTEIVTRDKLVCIR